MSRGSQDNRYAESKIVRDLFVAAFEALERRQMLSSSQPPELLSSHVPGWCACAGCRPQAPPTPLEQELARPGQRSVQSLIRATAPAVMPTMAPRVPLDQVRARNSLPGASTTIYLDFNGAAAFTWAGQNNDGTAVQNYSVHGPGGANDPVPAFTLDGNANDFTTVELDAIDRMWEWVSEKFSPFDVNVTTVDPGSYTDNVSIRVLIGGASSDWLGGNFGGRASIGAFTASNLDNTCFVFPVGNIHFSNATGFSTIDLHYLGETIAHEAGHMFGLPHQRQGNGGSPNEVIDEYYDGTSTISPIMGGSSNNGTARGIWWKTNMESGQRSPDSVVDEAIELGYVLGAAPDPQLPASNANTWFNTDNQGNLSASGVISYRFDADGFKFNANGPSASFTIRNAGAAGMLSPRGELLTYPGYQLVTTTNTLSSDGRSYTVSAANLAVGQQYVLNVHGDFSYGSLGQYTVQGSVQTFARLQNGVLYVNGFDNVNDDIQLDLWFLPEGTQVYVDDAINGDPSQVAAVLVPWSQVNSIVINTGSGNDTVRFLRPLPAAQTTIDMGSGTDSIDARGSNGVWQVESNSLWWAYHPVAFNSTVERLYCRSSSSYDDNFYINSVGSTAVLLYGAAGNDAAQISRAVVSSLGGGQIRFYGEDGSDILVVDDSTSSTGRSFTIMSDRVRTSNSGVTRDFEFDGTVESVRVLAGSGDDSVNAIQLTSGAGLSVYGGAGHDVFRLGNNNLQANLTNAASCLFDGQDGHDTAIIDNLNNVNGWNYYSYAGSFVSAASGYSWTLTHGGVEQIQVNAGPANDSFNVETVSAGGSLVLSGGGGYDTLDAWRMVASGSFSISGIQGPITFDAGAGGGRIRMLNNFGGGARTTHVDASSIGAWPGDSLFSPGAYIRFSRVSDNGSTPGLELLFGRGSDTIYAKPLANATIVINGGGQGTTGDQLNLALAEAQGYSINPTSATSGNVTSSNLKTLSWSSIEQPIAVDAVAPAVLTADINLNGIAVAGVLEGTTVRQSIDVQFSEDVSALIHPSWIELINLTTGQTIPSTNIAVSYDTATNTAHFTFPGYPDGVLPSGNYAGRVCAGLPDLFGNALPADAPFEFFFLAGDVNHDRLVDTGDLDILTANWQGSGKRFSDGDLNYDGVVNVRDLYILSSNWQQYLLPPLLMPSARSLGEDRTELSIDELIQG